MCIVQFTQEPKDDKDEDNCKKINEFLNNPRSATNHNAAQSSGSSSGKATPGTAASMMNNLPPEILQGLGCWYLEIIPLLCT